MKGIILGKLGTTEVKGIIPGNENDRGERNHTRKMRMTEVKGIILGK